MRGQSGGDRGHVRPDACRLDQRCHGVHARGSAAGSATSTLTRRLRHAPPAIDSGA
jgi:hypothetical protein